MTMARARHALYTIPNSPRTEQPVCAWVWHNIFGAAGSGRGQRTEDRGQIDADGSGGCLRLRPHSAPLAQGAAANGRRVIVRTVVLHGSLEGARGHALFCVDATAVNEVLPCVHGVAASP